jgi:hypothetical protein
VDSRANRLLLRDLQAPIINVDVLRALGWIGDLETERELRDRQRSHVHSVRSQPVSVFPYDNIVAGILVLVVAFGFHWMGQALSILNWDLATRLGLQEKDALPEYRVYEHAIAVADTSIGWIYGVAGVGLLLGTSWGYKLAWVPGVILVYHAVSFWMWTGNQYKAGHRLFGPSLRVGWTAANTITGLLTIIVAWNGS